VEKTKSAENKFHCRSFDSIIETGIKLFAPGKENKCNFLRFP